MALNVILEFVSGSVYAFTVVPSVDDIKETNMNVCY
jgi:hypothetical protein